MHCPVCACEDTHVVDSRLSSDGTSVRRRRECATCEYRFSTYEEIEILDIRIVKRNGSKEMYAREKLERGLRRALEKRSHTASDMRTLIHAIERDIQKLKAHEVTTSEIGEIVMRELEGFDKVAYIRFASVYRSFEDVKTFQDELRRLSENGTSGKKKIS